MTDYIAYAYAITVAVGGIVGYIKKGSMMSAIMGLAFGGLIGFGAHQTSQNPSNFHLSMLVAAILAGIMGKRWISGGVFMPAGLVAGISILMFTRYALRWVEISNSGAASSGDASAKDS